MARNEVASSADALFAAVAERPDDTAAYLVLADALEQAGDPRAELIQIQLRLPTATGVERDALAAREEELLAARRAEMLPANLAASRAIELEYKHGFLAAVTVSTPLEPTDMGRALAGIFASPHTALLQTVAIVPFEDGSILDLDYLDDNDDEADDPAPAANDDDDEEEAMEDVVEEPIKGVLEVLATSKARVPTLVKQLVLGRAFQNDRGYRCFDYVEHVSFDDDLSTLLVMFPHVESVRVDLGCVRIRWQPLVSERLRRFEYVSPFIRSGELEAFAKSKLPSLEALSLWTGSCGSANSTADVIDDGLAGVMEERGGGVDADHLSPLFAQLESCERFRELGFPNCGAHIPTLCDEIARKGRLAAKLEVLDFSRCDLDDDDAEAIKKLTARMPALREIRVEGAFAANDVLLQLKTPGVTVVGKPGRGKKRYRYIVTHE